MDFLGYKPTALEIVVFSSAAGVAVATATLLINMAWEAFKNVTGRCSPGGTKRCIACMDPAEPGSCFCAKHSRISNVVRRRSLDSWI